MTAARWLAPILLLIANLLQGQAIQQTSKSPDFSDALRAQQGFLKNIGQVKDLNNQAVESVLYAGTMGDRQVYLTTKGLSFLFYKAKLPASKPGNNNTMLLQAKQAPSNATTLPPGRNNNAPLANSYELERVDLNLLSATINPANVQEKIFDGSASFSFYNSAADVHRPALRAAKELLVKNIYPGIDWKIYLKETDGKYSLKYDFIVHSGADAALIRLTYSKNGRVSMNKDGLLVTSKMGKIRESKPVSYLLEDASPVNASFKLSSQQFSFVVAGYKRDKTLVIDPEIFWQSYLGSSTPGVQSMYMNGKDVRTDGAGNIYVQLSSGPSVPFPTLNPGGGAYYQDATQPPFGGMIIMKFNTAAKLLWSTYVGGGSIEAINMAVAADGTIMATGKVQGAIPLLNNGGYFDDQYKSNCVVKFDPAGKLVWCSYFTNFATRIHDITCDGNNNFYIVGASQSYDFPVVDPGGGAYCITNTTTGYSFNMFVSQFDPTNNLVWSTTIQAGNGDDLGTRVHADKAGNVFVVGGGRSNDYPIVDAGGFVSTTTYPTMLSRFDKNHKMTWSTYFDGSFPYKDLTTDDAGNIYLASGKWLYKFDASTKLLWQKSVPTTHEHFFKDIEYDPVTNKVLVLGIMNEFYLGFPTQNTGCNNSFYQDGINMEKFGTSIGPIFWTVDTDGNTEFLSLADWMYEYYSESAFIIDINGDPIYLFKDIMNSATMKGHDLVDPGDGAWFQDKLSIYGGGAMILKLQSSGLQVESTMTAPADCISKGSITTTVTCGEAPFSYIWSDNSTGPDLLSVSPGEYWVQVTDNKNLSRKLKFTVPPATSNITVSKEVAAENCDKKNGSVMVTGISGGIAPFLYSMDGGAFTAAVVYPGLDSGRHVLTTADASGCLLRDTIVVGRIAGPDRMTVATGISQCGTNNGTITINDVRGTGNFEYSLNGEAASASNQFTGVAAGVYQVTVYDQAGCSLSQSAEVLGASPPTEVSILTEPDHCQQMIGAITAVSVTGGTSPFTYSVDNINYTSENKIRGLTEGTYRMYVKDANNCILIGGGYQVAAFPSPVSMRVNAKDAICGLLSGSIIIDSIKGGAAPYRFSVDQQPITASSMIGNISPGGHSLRLIDNYGCTLDQAFDIEHVSSPRLELTPADTLVCYNQPISWKLTASEPLPTVPSWNIASTGYSATMKASGDKQVIVQVRDRNNCIISDTARLRVKACNAPQSCVSVPNAFSPNADRRNDEIGPVVLGCLVSQFHFKVYNRYGQVVFESFDPGIKWDGKFKNGIQPNGTYVYTCDYTGDDGIRRNMKGTFVLVR